MNLLWHHFKKDVRHVRWGLAIWGALLAVQAGVAVAGAWELDEMTRGFVTILSFLMPLLQTLLLLVLVPWLMQDEPAVGTTAFWLTRPMTAEFVLGSKAFFVGALVVAPQVGLELLLMGMNGVEVYLLMLAVPEIVLKTLGIVLPLAVVASITPSVGRYALWLIGVFVGMALVSTLAMFLMMYFGDEQAALARTTGTMAASSQIVSGLIYIVAGTALVVWQYRTRATRWTVMAAAVLLILAFNTALFWRIDFFAKKLPEATAVDNRLEEARMVGNIQSMHTTRIAQMRGRDDPQREVRVELSLVGLPAGFVGVPNMVEAKAVFADGTDVRSVLNPVVDRFHRGLGGSEAVVTGVLPGVKVIGTRGGGKMLTEVLRLPEAEAVRLAEQPFHLGVEVVWAILRGRLDYRMPLREGNDHRSVGRRETIRSFSRLGRGVTVTMLVRNVQLLFAPEEGGGDRARSAEGGGVLYGLYHPERQEFWAGVGEFDWQAGLYQSQILVIRPHRIDFEWEGPGESPVDDEWLAGAELVRITTEPVARLERSTTLDGLVLKESN